LRKKLKNFIGKISWKDKPIFWNNSYFIASCGGVTIEVLKKYIKQQDSPVES
jgi:putative transposase